MKIKTKKQLNLPQLIEWGWDNDVRNKNFQSEGGAIVYFDYEGNLTCARGFVPQDFFTVEVEEEITEDTVIPKMLILDNDGSTRLKENHRTSYYRAIATKALYLINDDYTMTLIWRDGKLVE